MKKQLLQIAFCISALLCCASCTEAQKKTNLSAVVFSENTQGRTDVTILDVRTPREYAEGHLRNALNIDWEADSFEKRITQLDRKKPVYVYCHSGRRSAAAADEMRKMGFDVYELKGGIEAWNDAKLPTE